jgi:hypothetical protein
VKRVSRCQVGGRLCREARAVHQIEANSRPRRRARCGLDASRLEPKWCTRIGLRCGCRFGFWRHHRRGFGPSAWRLHRLCQASFLPGLCRPLELRFCRHGAGLLEPALAAINFAPRIPPGFGIARSAQAIDCPSCRVGKAAAGQHNANDAHPIDCSGSSVLARHAPLPLCVKRIMHRIAAPLRIAFWQIFTSR